MALILSIKKLTLAEVNFCECYYPLCLFIFNHLIIKIMNINFFIKKHSIQPADAIIMKKKFFGMLDHYVIYLGIHNRQHTFVANYTKGIQFLNAAEIQDFLKTLVPTDIRHFQGNQTQRQQAIDRAISRVGENDYSLFENNCEHYKNYVHHGVHYSQQSNNAKDGLTFAGIALFFAGMLGLAANIEEDDDNDRY